MNKLDKKIDTFVGKINNIITDLINEGTYEDFISLQNSEKCANYSIYLEEDLNNKFSKIDLVNFSKTLLIGTNKSDEKINNKNKDELCSDISVFYIRIFNILAAIFSAVNPENNMYLRRLNALFKPLDNTKGIVSVCNNDPKLYPSNILDLDGIKELLELYTIYNIEGNSAENDIKKKELNELKNIIESTFKATKTNTTASGVSKNEDNESNDNNETDKKSKNGKVDINTNIGRSIKNNLEKIKSNVANIKNRVTSIEDKEKSNQELKNNTIPNTVKNNNMMNLGKNNDYLEKNTKNNLNNSNSNLNKGNLSKVNKIFSKENKVVDEGSQNNLPTENINLQNNKQNNKNNNEVNSNQKKLENNGSGMEPNTTGNQTPLANNGSGMEPNGTGMEPNGSGMEPNGTGMEPNGTGNQTPLANNGNGMEPNGSGMEPNTSGNQTPLANNGTGMESNGTQMGNNKNSVIPVATGINTGNNKNLGSDMGNLSGNNKSLGTNVVNNNTKVNKKNGNNNLPQSLNTQEIGNTDNNKNTKLMEPNKKNGIVNIKNNNITKNNKNRKNIQDGGKKTRKNRKNRKLKMKNTKGGGFFDNIKSAVSKIIPEKKETTNETVLQSRESNPKTIKDFKKIMNSKNTDKSKVLVKGTLDTDHIPTNLSQKEECNGKKLNVEIDKGNDSFKDFIRNHDRMIEDYVRFNKTFLDIIDNNLIVLNKNGYKLRNINEKDLDNIEKKTREILIQYYTTCQKTFTESFALLVKGVEESGLKPTNTPINNETPNNKENPNNINTSNNISENSNNSN